MGWNLDNSTYLIICTGFPTFFWSKIWHFGQKLINNRFKQPWAADSCLAHVMSKIHYLGPLYMLLTHLWSLSLYIICCAGTSKGSGSLAWKIIRVLMTYFMFCIFYALFIRLMKYKCQVPLVLMCPLYIVRYLTLKFDSTSE